MVDALAVDPADSKTLYAVMRSSGTERFAVSTDWGATWDLSERFPTARDYTSPFAQGAWRVYIDHRTPKSDRTVYVLGDNTVSVREGGRWSHRRGPEGVAAFNDSSLGIVDGGVVVYAVAEAAWADGHIRGGVYVSRDAGKTWTETNEAFEKAAARPGGAPRFPAVAACLNSGNVAYVSYGGLAADTGENETVFGTAKTSDGGRSWELSVRDTNSVQSPNVRAGWLDLRFGPEWGEYPLSIGVAPNNPDICYGCDYGRTMRTTDGGKTWEAVYSKRLDGAWITTWTTTGLDMTTCYGVHWDPFDSMHVFVSYTDIGLMESRDGGTSWQSATANGVPRNWVNTTYWLVFDPAVRGRAWAVMTAVHDLPRPKMFRTEDPASYVGGACVTEDGGKSWTPLAGIRQTAPTDIIMDPRSTPDARVLYVAGFGTGVWKTTDGGKTWSLKNNGIEGEEPFAWRIVMDAKGALYLVCARRSEDGSFGTARDGAVYKSTDGAETWRKLPLPGGLNGPHGLAVDPNDTNRVYLAAWGRYVPTGDRDGGIWLSEDGGETWKNIFSRQQHMYDVTIDPNNPDTLYSGSMSFSVWRSTDRGATWSRLKGYDFKQANRVIVDPFDPSMIYVTTFGGSVWHGPAAGDPNATEDIITPEVAYETYVNAAP